MAEVRNARDDRPESPSGARRAERRPFTDSSRLLARGGEPEDRAMSLVLVSGVGLGVFAGLVYLAAYAC